MNKDIFFRVSFAVGFVAVIIGAWLKITHSENADIVLTIGIIGTIIYTIIALYEIHSSKKVDASEKVMWTVGFIFINTITGLVYFFIGRKRIINKIEI